eukprot:COSAG02_NODE_40222_length_408_cov_0.440129_1_plen_100_part_10
MFEFQVYYISKTNMPTYLDWLPDDVLNMVYKYMDDRAIVDAIKVAKRKQIPYSGKYTNNRVIYSWMNNIPWHSLSMNTNGKSIYSYCLEIGIYCGMAILD